MGTIDFILISIVLVFLMLSLHYGSKTQFLLRKDAAIIENKAQELEASFRKALLFVACFAISILILIIR